LKISLGLKLLPERFLNKFNSQFYLGKKLDITSNYHNMSRKLLVKEGKLIHKFQFVGKASEDKKEVILYFYDLNSRIFKFILCNIT